MELTTLIITALIALWRGQELLLEPEVTIQNGKISGTVTVTRKGRDVLSFRGIPYGKAPIGSLRFRSPEPADPWQGTLLANSDPEPCPQLNYDNVMVGNEDCLKLNVYTPKIDSDNLLPVMVYIHGGEFVRGDISSTTAGPEFLLDYDVILVAMQYRLSVLGFISTGDEIAPGNFGLKDQVLALHWVQENIQKFGGDPNRVTLFGQSAGGVCVNLHVLSKLSDGLFHQFIAQSGSALSPWAFEDSTTYKDYSFALGKDLGCPTNTSRDLINCLRDVDIQTIIRDYDGFVQFRRESTVTWLPTKEPKMEGAFLTDQPINLILEGRMKDLPNISGVVKDEGLVLTIFFYANDNLYDSVLGDVDSFFTTVSSSFVSGNTAAKMVDAVKHFYLSTVDLKNKTQVLAAISEIVTDSSFRFPQILQLQLATKKLKSPHYYYSFNYRGTFSETSYVLKDNRNLGVEHTDDLIYLFPNDYSYFGVAEKVLSEEDHKMVDIVTELWTSFAMNGIPTTSYAADPDIWLTYNDQTNIHLEIGSGSTAKVSRIQHYLEPRMHFWAVQILKLVIFSG